MNYPKKSPYKTYRQAFAQANKVNFFDQSKLLILRGEADFLVLSTIQKLRELCETKNWAIERWDAQQVNPERFLQAATASSMFDPATLTIINHAQGKGDILALLQSLRQARDLRNPICLLWHSNDLGVKMQKECDRLNGFVLACDPPAPWEYRDFVNDRAQHHGLNLQNEAADLVLDAIGSDLFRLDNEISRLSFCLPKLTTAVPASALRPLLGFLREDHIFKLDQLLCQEAYSKALLLLKDLLDRGEKELALLAILAMHCRKALQIQAGQKQGMNIAELAKSLRLPPTVVQSYIGYVQRRGVQGFMQALRLCHEADRRLKSRGFGEELYLDQIIWELKAHSRQSKLPAAINQVP